MLKTAIYCRLSEEDRNKKISTDDSESIQNQKSMLLSYAIEKGYEVYGIYSDDDFAGADRNRPEWNKLLSDAEQKKFDIILCKSQSRFTREMEMVEKYIHYLFPLWGIRFIGLVDYADSDDKGNKKSRQINGLVNEWYIEDMSDNIKKTLTNRRQQGYHIGSFALYGYIKDPRKKGCLLIDEEAAEVVREVFNLYANGYGRTAIARILNGRSVPNPTEYKRLKGIKYKPPASKTATLWKYFAISDMLTNEMYIGNMVQGKYGSISYKSKENKPRPKESWIRVENTHEPIIDRQLWDTVQEIVRQKTKPFNTGQVGLFAKKVKCMYCGYYLRSSKNHGNYYLQCETKYHSKDACIGAFISVKSLEETVIFQLKSLLNENLDRDTVENYVSISNDFDSKIMKLQTLKSEYETKISEYAKSIKEVYVDKVKGLISEAQFVEFSQEFTKDREKFIQLAAQTDEEISVLECKRSEARDKRQIIEEYSDVRYLDRIMVEKLIDHICVGKRDKDTKQIEIEIHWSF